MLDKHQKEVFNLLTWVLPPTLYLLCMMDAVSRACHISNNFQNGAIICHTNLIA